MHRHTWRRQERNLRCSSGAIHLVFVCLWERICLLPADPWLVWCPMSSRIGMSPPPQQWDYRHRFLVGLWKKTSEYTMLVWKAFTTLSPQPLSWFLVGSLLLHRSKWFLYTGLGELVDFGRFWWIPLSFLIRHLIHRQASLEFSFQSGCILCCLAWHPGQMLYVYCYREGKNVGPYCVSDFKAYSSVVTVVNHEDKAHLVPSSKVSKYLQWRGPSFIMVEVVP